jgi:glycosyltransferase involved in cell wall biosynthesis
MLEAMATGTPVAAYPVDGPLQVLGADLGKMLGGVLHEDLRTAAIQALSVPRQQARARSEAFGWDAAAQLFFSHLVSVHARQGQALPSVTLLSVTT